MLKAIKNFHDKYNAQISVILKFGLVLGFMATIFLIFRPDLNNHSNVRLPDEIQWRKVGDTMVITKISGDSIHVEFIHPEK